MYLTSAIEATWLLSQPIDETTVLTNNAIDIISLTSFLPLLPKQIIALITLFPYTVLTGYWHIRVRKKGDNNIYV